MHFAWSRRSRATLLIVSLGAVLSNTTLAAEGDGMAIEGRWESTRKDLVLDVARCGDGYCGQLVKPDKGCDRTVLTVALKTTSPDLNWVQFSGDLALPNAGRINYKVRVSLTMATDAKPASMLIVGDRVDPDPMRRSFPYRSILARIGEATCRPRITS
ncbi:MAG: hypothetical protein U1E60_21785 [Reyranellaceae bacterium]